MCRYTRLPRHRMAHQATDAAIAVREWVDVVQAVVSRCHGDDAARPAHLIEPVALGEVVHEVIDATARGWHVPSDGDIVLWSRTPFSRVHHELPTGSADVEHRVRGTAIELAMEPPNELDRRRLL